MKILAICGSPRKGNTEFMLRTVLDECKAKGAETELILLREKDVKHCTGCDKCYQSEEPCYIDDDMKQIISKLKDADVIIYGTPNYFRNVSGMMKIFIDRTNEMIDPNKLKGKKFAFVAVGGQDLNSTEWCKKILTNYCNTFDLDLIGSVLAKAEGPKDLDDNKEVIELLKNLAQKISK